MPIRNLLNLFVLLTLPLLLTGCIGVAIIAGAGAGIESENIIHDNRSVNQQFSDRTISDKAHNALLYDVQLNGRSHINVATYNGVMLLVGQVQTPDLKQRAQDIVTQIRGVKRVYNELTINSSASFFSDVDDSWITTKVKTMMMKRKELQATHIKVITDNGVVYLMGNVSSEQGALAADTARRVKGVVKVVEAFQ